MKALPVPAATSPALQPFQRTRREAAGAAQRSGSQTCPCRGSLRAGQSADVVEVKEVLPARRRDDEVDYSALGGTSSGQFREGICCDKQAAPGWTLRATSPLMRSNGKRIADLALKSRLPSVYGSREFVDTGGLMYYGADEADSYRRVAYLRGQNPEGSQACRSAGGATDQVRVRDQSQDGKADRRDDSSGAARPREQADQVIFDFGLVWY